MTVDDVNLKASFKFLNPNKKLFYLGYSFLLQIQAGLTLRAIVFPFLVRLVGNLTS